MEFLFALHQSEEFDSTPHRHRHAVSILSVCNIKCRSTALNLTGQKREVHLPASHEIGRKSIWNLADERLKLSQLIQPSLTPSTKGSRCMAPYVARVSAEGAINRVISWTTLASFLSCIFRQALLNISSRNKGSGGSVCSFSSTIRQRLLVASVMPKSDLSIKLPLVARTVV